MTTHTTQKAKVPEEKKASEFLANERTFLAWIRTSVAIISLGFVVAKFDVWLRELALRLAPQAPLAAVHYHYTNLAIEQNEVKANRVLIVVVAGGVVLVAIMMVVYLLATVRLAGANN